MTNIEAIAKEARKHKRNRYSRKLEWRSIEAMKKLDNEIAVSFLVKSGIDKEDAEERVFNDSFGDDQIFSREAYLHITEKRKEKQKLLKSLTGDQE